MQKKDQKLIDGLVEEAKNGNIEAFGRIYDIFLADIYRFIFYKVTHKELAEDLTEDAFLKAWQNLSKYQKTEFNFSSWLYRIAHNTVIDHLRKEHVNIEEIIGEIHDERMDSQAGAEQFFNQQMLQRALVTLPEVQREVVILKYVNDLSHTEIAKVLDKSETAIRTLLSRALAKLKETVERFENEVDK